MTSKEVIKRGLEGWTRAGRGSRPCPVLGTYALLVVPPAGAVFKDAALRGRWP